ncbi:response regulator [Desulfovibrio mangrovi]|uniref:HD domain-containing phosphohydrolase n=1 Tax=Desulfovibrio mangrovi TaxID=2976983 RepID=UPI00224535F7|nr:HD domain-containing phosphohydrolase [Desulfovibrio mangrovi]UZP67187.1 response regulator [Desulfovibrio mangrovi]
MQDKPITILLVEDEPVIALDIRRRLQQLGYSTLVTVTSGEEAVQRAESIAPDIILMDIILSGSLDGIDAAALLRKQISAPVIYLTAHADEATLRRAMITEPFGYILKPFEDRELHTCIEMALYKHRMESDIRNKERWFATTLRSIGDAVITLDGSGFVTIINAAAARIFEITEERATGRLFSDQFRVRDDSTGQIITTRTIQASNGQYTQPSPATVETRSGRIVPVDISVSGTIDPLDQTTGSVIVLRDATDRKRSEEVLRTSLGQLRRTFEQTVLALAVTAEKRDPYTAGHQTRVAKLACAIADLLGLHSESIEAVRVAGTLHDIGKIYIPAEILAKPGKLTGLEMDLMRTHTTVGRDILSQISFPWPVADIVHQHHERLDGSGYPNGLSAKDILQEAKILAVADVVEAMSSHRPYRPSLGLPPALDELRSGIGTAYDKDAAEACIALFDVGFTFPKD